MGLRATITILRDELKVKDDAVTKLQSENTFLCNKLTAVKLSNNDLKQFCRKDNLVITNVPASYSEAVSANTVNDLDSSTETQNKVIKLFKNELELDIEESDIPVAHRLPTKSGHLPILVRFMRRSTRDLVYHSRFALKKYNTGKEAKNMIFINEDLSLFNRNLFSTAWRIKGPSKPLESVWMTNCRVLVKKDGHTIRITTMEQLLSLQNYESQEGHSH